MTCAQNKQEFKRIIGLIERYLVQGTLEMVYSVDDFTRAFVAGNSVNDLIALLHSTDIQPDFIKLIVQLVHSIVFNPIGTLFMFIF